MTDISKRMAEAGDRLRRDMERLLPSREEQHARLERLIDVAGFAQHPPIGGARK